MSPELMILGRCYSIVGRHYCHRCGERDRGSNTRQSNNQVPFLSGHHKKEPPVHLGGLLRFLVNGDVVIEGVLRDHIITFIFLRVGRIQVNVW